MEEVTSELRPEGEKDWLCRHLGGWEFQGKRRTSAKALGWGGELGVSSKRKKHRVSEGSTAGERSRVHRSHPALQTRVRNEGFILSAARSHSLEAPSWGQTHDPIHILNRGLWLLCVTDWPGEERGWKLGQREVVAAEFPVPWPQVASVERKSWIPNVS